MPVDIRRATPDDRDALADLAFLSARRRQAAAPGLWQTADDARTRVETALDASLGETEPRFRQRWHIASAGGRAVGAAKSILLPVPPIYAGDLGMPGLMTDCIVSNDAPPGTTSALLDATETDLKGAGARILLAATLLGSTLAGDLAAHSYAPLTLYLGKSGLDRVAPASAARPATADDLPEIIKASAAHRKTLSRLDPFWAIHPEADARFAAWMDKSLSLPDRDMFVSEADGRLTGYVIAQPATALHIPPAFDAGRIGMIDDFHHEDVADSLRLDRGGRGAAPLLASAEAAFAARDIDKALVVCPAAWQSKRALLEAAGFTPAIVWLIKR